LAVKLFVYFAQVLGGTESRVKSSHRPRRDFLGRGVGDSGYVVGRPGAATPSIGALVGRRRGWSPTPGHVWNR